MRKPAVPRRHRDGFMIELADVRRCDCTWPRRDPGNRPRCGRCFGCDVATSLEIGTARVH